MSLHKLLIATAMLGVLASGAMADTFGAGPNQFTIDFVAISGDASGADGTSVGPATSQWAGFADPGVDYRIGVYEITADQWTKFVATDGAPDGSPSGGYNSDPANTGNKPVDNCSYLEAAQFVNWLNTYLGHQEAYKFVETSPGDPSTLTFDLWDVADSASANIWIGDAATGSVQTVDNRFRHKDAMYFLPTEDEWVKAGHWNSADPNNLQTYTTVGDVAPVAGTDANFSTPYPWPQWDVGSGTAELNGTYDMAGNAEEFMESPNDRDSVVDLYTTNGAITRRGGQAGSGVSSLAVDSRNPTSKDNESAWRGFRVASAPLNAMLGDFDGDNDVDDDDIDILCANMGGDVGIYDMDGDLDVDEDDMIYHVENLVELQDGSGRVGTKRGDMNLDGFVNATDLAAMKPNFGLGGKLYADGDLDCDGVVNGTDLAILAGNIGFAAPTGAVPEPITMSLLAAGGLALLRRTERTRRPTEAK